MTPIKKLLSDFYNRYFYDEESLILLFLIATGLLVLLVLGRWLAPVITAVIFAYLMHGLITPLQRIGMPGWLAFGLVYTLFMGLFLTLLLYLIPRAWEQLVLLGEVAQTELPELLFQLQQWLMVLPQDYPNLFSRQQIQSLIDSIGGELDNYVQALLQFSWNSISSIVYWIVFLVLVPILVFFILRDKEKLVKWSQNFLPRNRPLMSRIWREMDQQVANYIRGKFLEILIVGVASYIIFMVMGLNYSLLLSVLVGLSVLVPYLGAAVVTVPVAAVAYVQWGMSGEFITVVIAYGALQVVDGNVLVPVIFSEAVNLHPVAIITAVLVFGGWLGLIGVFFAIPLATLIMAIINAWPTKPEEGEAADAERA